MRSASWLLSQPESLLFLSPLPFTTNGTFKTGKKCLCATCRDTGDPVVWALQSGWAGLRRKPRREGSGGELVGAQVWGRGRGEWRQRVRPGHMFCSWTICCCLWRETTETEREKWKESRQKASKESVSCLLYLGSGQRTSHRPLGSPTAGSL